MTPVSMKSNNKHLNYYRRNKNTQEMIKDIHLCKLRCTHNGHERKQVSQFGNFDESQCNYCDFDTSHFSAIFCFIILCFVFCFYLVAFSSITCLSFVFTQLGLVWSCIKLILPPPSILVKSLDVECRSSKPFIWNTERLVV